jgi:hypothetical protein
MPRPLIALTVSLILTILFSTAASAQAPSGTPPELRPSLLEVTESPQDAPFVLTPPDPQLLAARRRFRLLLAVGAGMVGASLAQVAWSVPHRICSDDRLRKVSLQAAALTGGLGLAFVIGGGTGLAFKQRIGSRTPATVRQIIGASAVALGAAITTGVFLAVAYQVEDLCLS